MGKRKRQVPVDKCSLIPELGGLLCRFGDKHDLGVYELIGMAFAAMCRVNETLDRLSEQDQDGPPKDAASTDAAGKQP